MSNYHILYTASPLSTDNMLLTVSQHIKSVKNEVEVIHRFRVVARKDEVVELEFDFEIQCRDTVDQNMIFDCALSIVNGIVKRNKDLIQDINVIYHFQSVEIRIEKENKKIPLQIRVKAHNKFASNSFFKFTENLKLSKELVFIVDADGLKVCDYISI